MNVDKQLAKRARDRAERLGQQLDRLDGRPMGPGAKLAQISTQAAALQAALASLPEELAAGLMSAELGFMPGKAATAALPGHGSDWQGRLRRLGQGADAVQEWLGPDGTAAYRAFLIRGYLRGVAHMWREATQTDADPAAGSEFFDFAAGWLSHAGVTDDPAPLLSAALASDWRIGSA
jgi:hypothetical protein